MADQQSVRRCSSSGFSVIELAIVLTMIGVVVLPMYLVLTNLMSLKNNEEKIELITSGLAEHLRVYGRLPCPADATLDSSDLNYAVEDCEMPTVPGAISPAPGISSDGVLIGAVPAETLLNAMDCGVPLGGSTPTAAQQRQQGLFRKSMQDIKGVIAGAVGTAFRLDKTSCLSFEHMIDDYGSKYLYAVTVNSTDLSSFDINEPQMGEIRINDQNGVSMTTHGQLFVVLSHGEDKKGAIQRDGTVSETFPCLDTFGFDAENCDRSDAVFVAMPTSSQQGSAYYDDYIDFSVAGMLREHSFWAWNSDTDTETPVEENIVFNPQVQRILIDQIADPATHSIDNEDILVINRGDLLVQPDTAGNGGDLVTDRTIRAQNDIISLEDIEAVTEVRSTQYCYDPPMTAACGAAP